MPGGDETLLSRAVAGDADALATLLERHGPQVRRELRIGRKWQSVLSVDDVMQVTYLEAFLRIKNFTPQGEGSFQGWVRRIAENNARDAIKGLECAKRPAPQRQINVPAGDDSCVALLELLGGTTTTPSRGAALNEVRDILETAIRALPKDYQTVVRQYDLQGRSASEVASSMARSKGAVHMLLARAHIRLREMLGAESKFFTDCA